MIFYTMFYISYYVFYLFTDDNNNDELTYKASDYDSFIKKEIYYHNNKLGKWSNILYTFE